MLSLSSRDETVRLRLSWLRPHSPVAFKKRWVATIGNHTSQRSALASAVKNPHLARAVFVVLWSEYSASNAWNWNYNNQSFNNNNKNNNNSVFGVRYFCAT